MTTPAAPEPLTEAEFAVVAKAVAGGALIGPEDTVILLGEIIRLRAEVARSQDLVPLPTREKLIEAIEKYCFEGFQDIVATKLLALLKGGGS